MKVNITIMAILKCVREGSRLRMKIISPGYIRYANCQCPRAIRVEGEFYECHPSDVTLVNTRGSYFYNIRASGIRVIVSEENLDEIVRRDAILNDFVSESQSNNSDELHAVILTDFINNLEKDISYNGSNMPDKVYDNGQPDCSICMSSLKELVYVPCGHFVSCGDCDKRMQKRNCPICRTVIVNSISHNLVK